MEKLTTKTIRYEYDSTEIYLLRAYNHSDRVYQDPFGHNEDMWFDDLEKAKQFVIDHRHRSVTWTNSVQGLFAPVDKWHGWEIITLQLISEVRALKQVPVNQIAQPTGSE